MSCLTESFVDTLDLNNFDNLFMNGHLKPEVDLFLVNYFRTENMNTWKKINKNFKIV